MGLLDKAKSEFMKSITSELACLINLSECEVEIDEKNGVVKVDTIPFTIAEGKLRMLGYCPKCAMEHPSTPIRTAADIADNYSRFKPMRHICDDVD